MNVWVRGMRRIGARTMVGFWRDDKGIGTLEIVLIAAVLILVAFLFKDWIMQFLSSLMGKAEDKAGKIFQ